MSKAVTQKGIRFKLGKYRVVLHWRYLDISDGYGGRTIIFKYVLLKLFNKPLTWLIQKYCFIKNVYITPLFQTEQEKRFWKTFNLVRKHMDWNFMQTEKWFRYKNPLISDMTPLDYFLKRPEKCEAWIKHLIDEATPVNVEDNKE